MNNFEYKKLTPFKWFVLENFPFIEADFDALTEWQLFCKLGKEINKIINSTNTLGTQVENLTTFVTNYFDNLDLQEEVNNKLNEMAKSGELEQIIAQFLNANTYNVFTNISSMKESTNLIAGSICQTLGFYNTFDGGASTYIVRQITNEDTIDEITKIALADNTLIAELQIKEEMNVKQFGAKGDAETDDTLSIQKCIDNVKIAIIPSGTFMIKAHDSEHLTGVYNHNNVIYNGGLKLHDNLTIKGINKSAILKTIPNNSENYCLLRSYENKNITIENINLIGDKDNHGTETGEWGHGIMILHSQNVLIKNCNISKMWGDGIYLGLIYGNTSALQNENFNILNNIIDDVSRNGISMCSGKNIIIENNKCLNIRRTNPQSGIDIEPESNGTTNPEMENIIINNIFTSNCGYGVKLYYTTAFSNRFTCKILNHFSINDRQSVYISAANGIINNENGLIQIDNLISENSGYSGLSITNWYNKIARILINNPDILNCNNTNHNTNNNLEGWRNGSGIVIYNDNNEILENIEINNLKVVDNRETKYINKSFFSYGMTGGKIILRNPIALFGINEYNFNYVLIIDDNKILTRNTPYYQIIINPRNLATQILSNESASERYIDISNTSGVADNNVVDIINNSENAIRFDLGANSDTRTQIFPFEKTNRYLRSTTPGATMKIQKINGKWYAIAYTGTWNNI